MGKSGYVAYRCPVHNGKSPTSGWAVDKGYLSAGCHGCGASRSQILDALGIEPPARTENSGGRQDTDGWEYEPPARDIEQETHPSAWKDDPRFEELIEMSLRRYSENPRPELWEGRKDGTADLRKKILEWVKKEHGVSDPSAMHRSIGIMLPSGKAAECGMRFSSPDGVALVYPLRYPFWSSPPRSAMILFYDNEAQKQKLYRSGAKLPPYAIFSPKAAGRATDPHLKGRIFVCEGVGDAAVIAAAGGVSVASGSAQRLGVAAEAFCAHSMLSADKTRITIIKDEDSVGTASAGSSALECFYQNGYDVAGAALFDRLRDVSEDFKWGENDPRSVALKRGTGFLNEILKSL